MTRKGFKANSLHYSYIRRNTHPALDHIKTLTSRLSRFSHALCHKRITNHICFPETANTHAFTELTVYSFTQLQCMTRRLHVWVIFLIGPKLDARQVANKRPYLDLVTLLQYLPGECYTYSDSNDASTGIPIQMQQTSIVHILHISSEVARFSFGV